MTNSMSGQDGRRPRSKGNHSVSVRALLTIISELPVTSRKQIYDGLIAQSQVVERSWDFIELAQIIGRGLPGLSEEPSQNGSNSNGPVIDTDPAIKVFEKRSKWAAERMIWQEVKKVGTALIEEYCKIPFGVGHYPWPRGEKLVHQFANTPKPVMFVGTSNVILPDGKIGKINFELDGKIVRKGHPALLRDENGEALRSTRIGPKGGLPEGEERWLRAMWAEEGMLFRFWLNIDGERDDRDGAAKYVFNGKDFVRVTDEEYDRLLAIRVGKKKEDDDEAF